MINLKTYVEWLEFYDEISYVIVLFVWFIIDIIDFVEEEEEEEEKGDIIGGKEGKGVLVKHWMRSFG